MTTLHFELQPAPPVPHGAFADPAGWCGPGNGGEGPAVDGHLRHLLFERRQVAALYHPEHVQQEESRKHLANVAAVRRRQHSHHNTVNASKQQQPRISAEQRAGGTYLRAARWIW